jgi:hypothetical protein
MPIRDIGVELLALRGGGAERIPRVKVPEGDLLSALVGHAEDEVVVSAVRGAHDRGFDTNDAHEGFFDAPHFVMYLIAVEPCQVAMGPGMRGDLCEGGKLELGSEVNERIIRTWWPLP